MHDQAPLDNELAAFTDQVLRGADAVANPATGDFAAVVRQLHNTITPTDPPSDAFRTRLRTRLSMEWDLQHPQPVQWWRSPRAQWVTAAAASLAIVFAAAIFIAAQYGSDGDTYSGTATFGSLIGRIVIGVLVISLSVLAILYRKNR
ncbi:MAG: hypothetical protein K8S97_16045 [Anaerolineae bacterium]|nr:hypothetical protein [Anaerolineae bacterium]